MDVTGGPRAHGTPSPPKREELSTVSPVPVIGEAPWALSAVPECFEQVRLVRGPASRTRVRLPPGSTHLRAGSVVWVADCKVTVLAREVRLARGTDRLIVPPLAAAYAAGNRLTVVRRFSNQVDVRYYRPSGANALRVEAK